MPRFALMLLLAVSMTACDLGPTAPEVKPPLPHPTYALYGVVSEMTASGLTPVEGVYVHVDSCPFLDGCAVYPSTQTTTDKNGTYTFPAVYGTSGNFTSSTYVSVWGYKDGYTYIPSGWSCVLQDPPQCSLFLTLTADTRLDVELVRWVAPEAQ